MSGTSLDGLDMAICEFQFKLGKWSFEIKHAKTISYPNELYERLQKAYSSLASELAKLHVDLGCFIGVSANEFINETNIKVDIVSSHGHTIFHKPELGCTLQIGSGAEIAAQTGIKTICDFRTLDVARGGQGAPLVPIGDELLFAEYDACVNLGGFANVSYRNNEGNRMAFDICPVNFVLNRLANSLGYNYDNEGLLAKSGKINQELLDKLNNIEYFSKQPPKSLGQEWVEEEVLPLFTTSSITDVLATYVEHVAYQLNKSLKSIDGEKVLLTGGGVFNKYLVQKLVDKTTKELIIPQKEIIDMKEALIFAFLGVLRIRGEVNCLASVTGAECNSVGGAVYLPKSKSQKT